MSQSGSGLVERAPARRATVLWILVRHEVTRQVVSARFRLLVSASVVLGCLAVGLGVRDHGRREQALQQRIQEQGAARARDDLLMGRSVEPALRVSSVPSATSVISQGLASSMPAYWDFGPSGVIEGRPIPSVLADSVGGVMADLESLVRLVLGLLAILLAAEAVTADRSSGVLVTLLSLPVTARVVGISRLLATNVSLALAVGVLAVSTVITLAATNASLLSAELLGRLAGFSTAAILYLAVMAALGLCVGALVRVPSAAATAAMVCWAYAALIGPQVVALAVRLSAPVAPADLTEAARQVLFETRLRATSELLGRTYVRLLGDEPLTLSMSKRPDVRAEINRLWQAEVHDTRQMLVAIDARRLETEARQNRLADSLSWVSPGSLFLDAATELQSTGRSHHARLTWRIREHHRLLSSSLFDDSPRATLFIPSERSNTIMSFERRPGVQVSHLPGFERPRASARDGIRDAVVPLAALLVLYVVVGICAVGRFDRLVP